MEETLLFNKTIHALKKFWWIILIIMIIGGVAGRFVASSTQKPSIYESYVSIFLEKQEDELVEKYFDDFPRFMATAINLVKTSVVLEPALKSANLDVSPSEIESKISVTHDSVSQVLSITVKYDDAETAVNLVNAIGESFTQVMPNYIDVATIEIVDYAEDGEVTEILQTRTNEMTVMGALIGLVIGTFLAFILYYIQFKRVSRSL